MLIYCQPHQFTPDFANKINFPIAFLSIHFTFWATCNFVIRKSNTTALHLDLTERRKHLKKQSNFLVDWGIDWLLLNYWHLFENYDWIIDSQILIFQLGGTHLNYFHSQLNIALMRCFKCIFAKCTRLTHRLSFASLS